MRFRIFFLFIDMFLLEAPLRSLPAQQPVNSRRAKGTWLKLAGIAVATLSVTSVARTSNLRPSATEIANGKGKDLFESSCAVCHGLDGRGGEHAPNIGRGSATKPRPDSDIARILRDGIPSKGMPAFRSLGDSRLRAVLSYLRLLQGKTETKTDTGNPIQGKELFFGEGRCSDCHAMDGQGSFLSTDLSDFAYDHSPDDIRLAITNPQGLEVKQRNFVRVVTTSGRQFSGVIRNENNSSLQLQDTNGQFYLLMKSELQSTERSPAPAMPADYRKKLNPAEIEDLVSYIVHQSPKPVIEAPRPARRKNGNQTE